MVARKLLVVFATTDVDAPGPQATEPLDERRQTSKELDDLRDKVSAATKPLLAMSAGEWQIVHCPTLDQLWPALEAATNGAQSPLDRLDFLGHGGPGYIYAGPGLLASSVEHLEQPLAGDPDRLARYLAPVARIRLLGCRTAVADDGRSLLLAVSNSLGGERVIEGTIDRLLPVHFDPSGAFAKGSEHVLLQSSLAALDGDAPPTSTRAAALIAMTGLVLPHSATS